MILWWARTYFECDHFLVERERFTGYLAWQVEYDFEFVGCCFIYFRQSKDIWHKFTPHRTLYWKNNCTVNKVKGLSFHFDRGFTIETLRQETLLFQSFAHKRLECTRFRLGKRFEFLSKFPYLMNRWYLSLRVIQLVIHLSATCFAYMRKMPPCINLSYFWSVEIGKEDGLLVRFFFTHSWNPHYPCALV